LRGHKFKVGDQVLLFNSRFKFYIGKLASRWQAPLVVQELYRSGAIRLHGDYKGKPNVVNGQRLKHYIAGEKFIGKVKFLESGSHNCKELSSARYQKPIKVEIGYVAISESFHILG
jgi:hypothetical protein